MRSIMVSALGLFATVATASLQIVPGATWTAVSRVAGLLVWARLIRYADEHRPAHPSSWWWCTQGWQHVVLVCFSCTTLSSSHKLIH